MNAEQRQETNAAIARRLGWRVTPRKVAELYGFPDDTVFDLLTPEAVCKTTETREELAWLELPDYCESLDAVVAALPHDIHLYIHYEADNSFTVTLREKSSSRFWCREGDTRAEAAALALRALLDAAEEGR